MNMVINSNLLRKKGRYIMTEEKICKNCEYYIPRAGRYGAGRCISDKSTRGNRDFTLSKDHCKCWERRTNE